ncbi:MAG: bifunctional riboflavin kinase/FAD synthetase [Pseudomonadota bacterium]
MLVLHDNAKLPPDMQQGIYAIGNFDGVHLGHQALLADIRSQADRAKVPAGVIMFEPHPRQFFQPDAPHFRLTTLDEKLRLLSDYEIDIAVVVGFSATLAGQEPEAFIADVLVDRLGVGGVVVGYDFHFGRRRRGTPAMMIESGQIHGFDVSVIEPQADRDGDVYSSSMIRDKLSVGEVGRAAELLGRFWCVEGVVEKGFQLGTDLGFPTANIALPDGVTLAHGIYAVKVQVGDVTYNGAAYFGGRPTVNTGAARLEVFLIDFSGDLYGEVLRVAFVEFLRGDKAFDDLDALKAQIAKDCDAARSVLAALPADTANQQVSVD